MPWAPHPTDTTLNESSPASVTENEYVCCEPSFTDPTLAAARVTTGATFATDTVWVSVLLAASSESLTCTETSELSGPSGNEQTKLPAPVVESKVSAPTWTPWSPHSVATSAKESTPASVTENEYVCCEPSFTDTSLAAARVTTGATFATDTVWVSVLLAASSESLTCTETSELSGPSGNEQTKLPAPVVESKVSAPTWTPWSPQIGRASCREGVLRRVAAGMPAS